MNTIIVYATKYGCTEKCAERLKEQLIGKVDLLNLKTTKTIDLANYDKVIIGGSIYMGRIQKQVTEFCTKYMDALKKKKVGLFICCMRDGDLAEAELNSAFPQELCFHVVAREYFGGEFILKKMNALDRFITKRVAKTDKDISSINENNISRFIQMMSQS